MKQTIIFIFFLLSSFVVDAQEIISPNGKIKVVLNLPAGNSSHECSFKILYKIESSFVEVLGESKLGINRADEQFAKNLRFIKQSKPASIHERICKKYCICAGVC